MLASAAEPFGGESIEARSGRNEKTDPVLEIDLSEHARLFRADGDKDSDVAVLAFGGIMQGLGAPEFEFFNTFNRLRMSALFVRDPVQSWYAGSIPCLGRNTDEIALSLRRLTAEAFPGRKVVAIGNSMGGFAAMMFGALCGFHSALCFAPQTFICPGLRERHGDKRWALQLDAISGVTYCDLRPLLARHPRFKTDIFIGAKDRLDGLHAAHLNDLENVTTHRFAQLFNGPGHDIANWLKQKGRLSGLLQEFLMAASGKPAR